MGASIDDAVKVELTETFSVWMVALDRLVHGSDDLRELGVQTGRWHHQIRVDCQTKIYARSRPLGADPSSWRITEVFQSELAQKIDASISWVDKNLEGNPLVRLLTIPAYHLTAFWLAEETKNQVIIVDVPAYYSALRTDQQVITQEVFFRKLRELSHIEGRTKLVLFYRVSRKPHAARACAQVKEGMILCVNEVSGLL